MNVLGLYLLFSLPAIAAIFGTDDRVQPSGAFRAVARSTALQVPLNFVSEGNGKLDLDFSALSDRSNYNFCSDESFASEKVSPIACTGFLVAPDLLVTAGHCAVNWTKVENTVTPQCEAFGWLFDYQVDAEGKGPPLSGIPSANLVKCKSVIYANFFLQNVKGKSIFGEDIALIRLDRAVTDREPLVLSGKVPALGEKLSMVGYPLGLPAKVSSGKTLEYGQDFFRTDLDVASGNSGSPVLNSKGAVAGVLVRSFPDADFVEDIRADCRRWNFCKSGSCVATEGYANGSEVQKIQPLLSRIR